MGPGRLAYPFGFRRWLIRPLWSGPSIGVAGTPAGACVYGGRPTDLDSSLGRVALSGSGTGGQCPSLRWLQATGAGTAVPGRIIQTWLRLVGPRAGWSTHPPRRSGEMRIGRGRNVGGRPRLDRWR